MHYLFPEGMQLNYQELKAFLSTGQELSKNAILEKCSGQVSFELLQQVKELEFECIGKDQEGRLYIS